VVGLPAVSALALPSAVHRLVNGLDRALTADGLL
jgi:hypothetical protein